MSTDAIRATPAGRNPGPGHPAGVAPTSGDPAAAFPDGHAGGSRPAFQRAAGLAGIAFFVIFFLIIVLSPDVGNPGDQAAVLRADVHRHATAAQVFTWVEGAQAVLLLLFVAGLWDRLRWAGQRVLATLGMAGAVGVLAVTAVQHASVAAMQYLVTSGRAEDSQLTLLNTVSYAAETVSRLPMAVLVGALSMAILRSRSLPRWLGYLGLAEALLCLVAAGTTGSTGVMKVNGPVAVPSLLLLLVWTLAGAIALLRTRERSA